MVLLYSNECSVNACLGQHTTSKGGQLEIIGFAHRILDASERSFTRVQREYLALLRATKVFWGHIYSTRFTVQTTSKNFKKSLRKEIGGSVEFLQLQLSPFLFDTELVSTEAAGISAWVAASVLPPYEYESAMAAFVPTGINNVRHQQDHPSFQPGCTSFVLTFDGSSSGTSSGGSAGAVLFNAIDWKSLKNKGIPLVNATVNEAEYEALILGLEMCIEQGITELTVFGDSQLVIGQVVGTKITRSENLKPLAAKVATLLTNFVKVELFHVKREFNASSDHLATLARPGKAVEEDAGVVDELNTLPEYLATLEKSDPAVVVSSVAEESSDAEDLIVIPRDYSFSEIAEDRQQRLSDAQDRVQWMKILKDLIRGLSIDDYPREAVRKAKKSRTEYDVNSNGVLFHIWNDDKRHRKRIVVQIVVPEEMRNAIVHSYHDEAPGGHFALLKTYLTLRRNFYWPGMYAYIESYCRSCILCQTSKRGQSKKAPSPGNVWPTSPMDILAMDIVGKLPCSNGATSVIVYTDIFTGYVWAYPLVETHAPACALTLEKVFNEVGVCRILRHDRDKRFVGELFKCIRKALGVEQRATMAYNPSGDGHVENRNKTVLQLLRVYCEDVNQLDWPLHLNAVCFAINASYDADRGDTPHYLFRGWDPKTTMEAMFPTPEECNGNFDAREWRRDANRVYFQVRELVYHAYRKKQVARARRSEKHSKGQPYAVGDRVWVYAQGVVLENRKLAHRWIGPFRIVETKDNQPHYYVLDVGRSQMHPQVHYDRLKKCYDHSERPTEKLTQPDLPNIDFDVDLLSPTAFEQDDDRKAISEILERRWTRATRHARPVIEYKVSWEKGGSTWVRQSDMDCPDLVSKYKNEHGPIPLY